MMPERLLSIKELSTKYDCSLRTLRYYEELGFLTPHRSDQQRRYNALDELKLKLILFGKRLGLSLRDIRNLILDRTDKVAGCGNDVETVTPFLSRDKIQEQIDLLTERRLEVDVAIAQLKDAQLRLASERELETA